MFIFPATPTNGAHGDICPLGFYCPNGTSVPYPCPPGTFGNQTLLDSVNACTPCTPGMYCADFNSTRPTGDCEPGHFCPKGATTSTDQICSTGKPHLQKKVVLSKGFWQQMFLSSLGKIGEHSLE